MIERSGFVGATFRRLPGRLKLAPATVCMIVFAGCAVGIGHDDGAWRLLFDGKTTAGWRGFRQDRVPDGWQAVDGALTRVGKGSDIITSEQFGDFELTLEWKIAPGGNS